MKDSLHMLFFTKNPDNRLCIFVPFFHSFSKVKICYIEG